MKKALIFPLTLIVIFISIALIFKWQSLDIFSRKLFSSDKFGFPDAMHTQIVELKNGSYYDLTATIVKKMIGGSEVKMLAYNGMIPGPTIKVQKGAEISINFTNNTDVPTTIHSHGVRLSNKFDGVPDMTQKEVGIGESFVYKIKFPDEG